MKTVIIKSFVFSVVAVLVTYLCRLVLRTDLYLTDVGGLGTFATVFGTLYGIMTAFVVFEVWGQFNATSKLVDKEGQGLERLYQLILYFRDDKLTRKMKEAILNYANLVIKGRFQSLGSGNRNVEAGKLFRKIAEVIREIRFDDDHDAVAYDHVLDHYGQLGQIRVERINQSLARLPVLLKTFLYLSCFFAIAIFIVMPFVNMLYSFLTVGMLAFVLAMIYHLVEDLDNPFVGHWNITPEPFERALKHIEEDY